MKIKFMPLAFAAGVVLSMSACGGNSTKQEDSLKQIDEMVKAVEAPPAFEGADKYNAEFFNNPEKQSETPSDSTYMTTSTGLKYVVIAEGEGNQPKATDVVTVHYTGTLTNGDVFDSSVSRGEPASFPLTRVIPGWTEGLQLMKEGGRTVFYIPSELAYGDRVDPTGPIPPNAPLIFWVQLLQVQEVQ